MSEDYIVRYGAPTLAGIKTGSLFQCPYESTQALMSELRELNRKLVPKGLRVLPLRLSEKRAMIYVYRTRDLEQDLSQKDAIRLLEQHGYEVTGCEGCLVQLVRRLRQQDAFPHEIGLFLGYPPEDVYGFIENRACGSKCTGCWRVYGDEAEAQRRFAQYKECTKVYQDLWSRGRSIEHLTVAS